MKRTPWVCLMYHGVVGGPLEREGGGGPERFSVTRDSFERMLDAIAGMNSIGSSVTAVLARPHESRVGISFDDGTIGQYEQAAPALAARGFTATFFVTTDWVGTRGFMSWDQLRELTRAGMSVQSHTKSHPHLSELERDRLRLELAESKARLDDELGQETTELALPGGNAPRRSLRHVLAEAGYSVVATSRWGRNGATPRENAEPRWLRRCNVPREITPQLAGRILTGDPMLTAARYSREAILNGTRALFGADRYARLRRRLLDAID